MITKELQFLNGNEEQVPFESPLFLYHAGVDEISRYYGRYVPWHWHRALEFSWVMQGQLKVKTNHAEKILLPGEGCFINSNFLHYYEAVPGEECIYFCQVFDPSILAGASDSVFGKKYVYPIVGASDLELYSLRPIAYRQRKILEILRTTQDMAEQRELGYELRIRNNLSEIWLLLYQEVAELVANSSADQTAELRIKLMMSYIQDHYGEKLTLEEIAAAASISTRECLRSFKNALDKTPFTYLTEYRVQQAASLLAETDDSITEIGERCGFASPSYFTKNFGKIMGQTPRAFRKKYRGDRAE